MSSSAEPAKVNPDQVTLSSILFLCSTGIGFMLGAGIWTNAWWVGIPLGLGFGYLVNVIAQSVLAQTMAQHPANAPKTAFGTPIAPAWLRLWWLLLLPLTGWVASGGWGLTGSLIGAAVGLVLVGLCARWWLRLMDATTALSLGTAVAGITGLLVGLAAVLSLALDPANSLGVGFGIPLAQSDLTQAPSLIANTIYIAMMLGLVAACCVNGNRNMTILNRRAKAVREARRVKN